MELRKCSRYSRAGRISYKWKTGNQRYDGRLEVRENGKATFSRNNKRLFTFDWSKAVFQEPTDSSSEQFEKEFVVFPPKEEDYIIRKHRF